MLSFMPQWIYGVDYSSRRDYCQVLCYCSLFYFSDIQMNHEQSNSVDYFTTVMSWIKQRGKITGVHVATSC